MPVLAFTAGGKAALTVDQLLGNLSRAGFGWRGIRWRPALLLSLAAVHGDAIDMIVERSFHGRLHEQVRNARRYIESNALRRKIVKRGDRTEATRILTEHKDDLEKLAQGLLEFETLSGEEIKDLLNGKRPVREDPSDESQNPPRGSAVPSTGARPRPDAGDQGLNPQPT